MTISNSSGVRLSKESFLWLLNLVQDDMDQPTMTPHCVMQYSTPIPLLGRQQLWLSLLGRQQLWLSLLGRQQLWLSLLGRQQLWLSLLGRQQLWLSLLGRQQLWLSLLGRQQLWLSLLGRQQLWLSLLGRQQLWLSLPFWKGLDSGLVEMDIIRGSLDSISRPASAPQHLGGRSNVSYMWLGTLEVLSPELTTNWDHEVRLEESSDEDENPINNVVSDLEATKLESSARIAQTYEDNFPVWRVESENERQMLLEDSEIWSSEGHAGQMAHIVGEGKRGAADDGGSTEVCGVMAPLCERGDGREEKRAQHMMHFDTEITKAFEKMQNLDAILAKKLEREEMVKRESKKQWKVQRNISASEMEEDFLDISFLIECQQGIIGDESLIKPVFCTQVPVCDTRSFGSKDQDEPESTSCSPTTEERETSWIGDKYHGKIQREELRMKKRLLSKTNFITKNIEAARNPITLTDDEKKRLNELLEDIDDMEGKASDNNAKSLPSKTPGVGFTLEIWEQQRLADIDNYLQAFQSEMLHHKIELTARESHIGQAMSKYWWRNANHGGKTHHWLNYLERLDAVDQRLTEIHKACSRNDSRLTKEQLEDLLWECTSRKGDACQTGDALPLPEYALIQLLEDAGASSSASDDPEGDLQDTVTFDQRPSYYMSQVLEGSKIDRLVKSGTDKSTIDRPISSDDKPHNYNNSDLCNLKVPNVESTRRPAFLEDPQYLQDIDGSSWQMEFSVLGNDINENEDCFDEY
uniref:fibrous sheath-interacting protein 1 n=1 Tax=Myxine glutinosa TaxID=7769 RepID=UPI00358EF2CB